MKIEVSGKNQAVSFEAEPQERLLFAGLAAGMDLPYECATGTCGTCKARLLSGELQDLWPDAPGKGKLKADSGEMLMCQCAASTPVKLEVGSSVRGASGQPARYHRGTIKASEMLTEDVIEFRVALARPASFEAGQFMAIRFPGIEGYRGYSMVNFDTSTRELNFVVKRLPGGGVSEWLFSSNREGYEVELFGPLGKASFEPALDKDIVCIAGGSGIAGMMSILERACREDYLADHKAALFFGVRTPEDAFFLDKLQAFKEQHPDSLEVTIAFSDQAATREWEAAYPLLAFDEGYVHEVARTRVNGSCADAMAYLAGPPPAVNASIRMLLMEAKMQANCIRYDKFS